MKYKVLFLILTCMLISMLIQTPYLDSKDLPLAINLNGVPATFTDVKYGSHERNLLDVWLADSDVPTPIVVFIHGGGFSGGDKSEVYESKNIPRFLDAGVSFATINYRYMKYTDARSVMTCLGDAKRSLQFIRSKADEWNLDKSRIGAYGNSAGAGTSLWLAFQPDMSDPNHSDPVLRESTRLKVAGAFATQATYDILKWPEILQIPVSSELLLMFLSAHGLQDALLNALQDTDSPNKELDSKIRKNVDLLGLMSLDDPPIYVSNGMRGGTPEGLGHLLHHPLHAVALKTRAEEVGLEAVVYAKELGIAPDKEKQETLVSFFLRHLTDK